MDKKIPLFLALIFLFQAFQLVHWVKEDESNPGWDSSWHMMIALNKYNQITGKADASTNELESRYPIFRFANNYYPPLFHISSIPFFLLFGESYDSGLLSNILFLLILVVSSFFIGKKIRGDNFGLMLAFILSSIPSLSFLMRDYIIDLSLVSMVSLSYVFLLYSEDFRNTRFSILSGISFGLGMLVKWTFFIFLVLPFSVSLFNFIRKKQKNKVEALGFAFFPAFILILSWYTLPRVLHLFTEFSALSNVPAASGIPMSNSPDGILFYIFAIATDFSFFYFIVFSLGVFSFFVSPKKKNYSMRVLANIFFIYIIFTLLIYKDNRYIYPIFLFMAIFLCCFLFDIKSKKLSKTVFIIILVLGMAFNISYNQGLLNLNYKIGGITLINTQGKNPNTPEIDIDEILQAIEGDNLGRPSTICIVSESLELNDVNIPYFSMRGNFPVRYMVGNGCDPLVYDYIIMGPIEKTWRSEAFQNSKSVLLENIGLFQEIYSKQEVKLYKRI